MASTNHAKDCHISVQLPDCDLATIDQAAAKLGCSRSEFVRDAAVCSAEEVVMETGPIRMSPEGFAEFMNILSAPAMPVPEFVELVNRPAPWEAGYVPRR